MLCEDLGYPASESSVERTREECQFVGLGSHKSVQIQKFNDSIRDTISGYVGSAAIYNLTHSH